MKNTLEKLWNDYLADESCKVGKEEKELIKKLRKNTKLSVNY